ncbi:hypothetical protein E4U32_007971 [Claviceps aff. humidiphila group G2b]|nr:hypothetical protein E4U32_007971 [Claviceps aff. humidiphila group G2b]
MNFEEAISRCTTWIDAAFAMSDEFKWRGLTSLVCLQAQTILSKVSCYMEGSSVRNRTLGSNSIAMARELGIHRIDLPGEERSSAFQTEIEVEMARRVWWDNVALDWYIALFPGPQEGVYTKNPTHPERIRLAEIGREYIDSCPDSEPNSHEQKQERLDGLNLKLDELQRNLPSHLALRKPGDPLDVPGPRTPSHVYQCINLNGLIYIVRCINHIRFLSFSRVVPRLSFPYQVSIQCAKDIIWMANVVKTDHPWILNRLKATSFIQILTPRLRDSPARPMLRL